METKHLASFVSVYELGSISKASESLYMSIQGLSKSIKNLEAELGQELFVRSNRGVVPTKFARVLYPKARQIIALVDSVTMDGDIAASKVHLTIATTSGYLLASRFLDDFSASAPEFDIEVIERNDEQTAELVASGMADVGFVAGPPDCVRFDAIPFTSHPFVLIVHESDILASRACVGLPDLEGRQVAIIGPGYAPNNLIRSRLMGSRVTPSSIIDVAEIATGINYAARGQALCVDADFSAMQNPRPTVKVLPFNDATFTWDVHLVTRKGTRNESRDDFCESALRWRDDHTDDMFLS